MPSRLLGILRHQTLQFRLVARALGTFAGLASVTLEDAALTAKALDWTVGGMDFADALHLAKTEGCDAMVSFDRRFARAATKLSNIEVRTP